MTGSSLFLATGLPDWLPSLEWVSLALALAILVVCLRIYGRLLWGVLAGHGRVWVEPLGLPDLLAVIVLFTWLAGMAMVGFSRPDKIQSLTDSAIFQSAALFGLVVGAIVLFLQARHIPVAQLFGFGREKPFWVLKKGAGLFLAVFPLVVFCGELVQMVVGKETQPQEIVKYFAQAAEHSDWWRLVLAAGLGVVVAPMTEEFIFRGYFYGVLRRYLGVIPGLLLTSLLFASIHTNLSVLLPLFVLASCLTLAYEATGSLWVPMVMHGLFNAVMLGAMFYSATHP